MDQKLPVDQRGLLIRTNPLPLPEGPQTVAKALAQGVRDHPDREALVDRYSRLTYKQLDDRVEAAAGALTALGLRSGDRFAVCLPNRHELIEAFLAAQRIGAIWLGIKPSSNPSEIRWMLKDSETNLFLTTPEYASQTHHRHTLTINPAVDTDDWTDLIDSGQPCPNLEIDPHAPAAIAYTSGTTDRPKGAVHSQHNILWSGISSRSEYPVSPQERHGTALACAILNLMILGPIWSFLRGTTAVLIDRTDPITLVRAIQQESINRITLVPTMAHDLIEHPEVTPNDLESLTEIIIGAAHTPPELRRRWFKKFGTWPLVSYGLTEAPSGVVRDRHAYQGTSETVGFPLEPIEVVVIDENGDEIPPGKVGEVCLRPRREGRWAGVWSPMLGYWNQPKDTCQALKGGLLHTNDLGFLNADGSLVIRGRRNQIIIRGGSNVYPAEIEGVILSHPAVLETVVVGLQDDRLGERIVAAVVVSSEVSPPPDLSAHCASKLARYKIPEQFLFLNKLPRNTMGKILQHELVNLFNC